MKLDKSDKLIICLGICLGIIWILALSIFPLRVIFEVPKEILLLISLGISPVATILTYYLMSFNN